MEEQKEHLCIYPSQRPFCPLCNTFSTLWKIFIGLHVVLMVTFALTLLLGTLAINRAIHDSKEARIEILASNTKVLDTVRQHMQHTMENRTVQTEIKGMLNAWIEERRGMKRNDKK